jgi:hypothetical protein
MPAVLSPEARAGHRKLVRALHADNARFEAQLRRLANETTPIVELGYPLCAELARLDTKAERYKADAALVRRYVTLHGVRQSSHAKPLLSAASEFHSGSTEQPSRQLVAGLVGCSKCVADLTAWAHVA